ncbi:Ig-like domain-containing protein [uncultured Aquimarina sp.]|uniref:Ig-like domain-containing protein n=1 Tax=uncultured Aquimarina sp. TaxID=575652 RepID=UPI0026385DD7|nr:Ig-like domain-containing protein [uncultured Aquimarina sp.]
MKHLFKILLVLISLMQVMYAQQSSLEFTFSKNKVLIKKDKLPEGRIVIFKGEISEDKLDSSTPILGKTIKTQEGILFTPVVPFGWNQKYTLVYNHIIEYFKLTIPENYEPLSVTKIYPSATILPSNLLKLYIQFSKPINTTSIYNHIRFINHAGDTLSKTILPLENPLISDDKTVLTLWIEPGRQKRGLKPNQQLGPVFNKETYRLIVTKNIKDNNGVSMQKDFIHSFSIGDTDRIKPTIDDWKIDIPKTNSTSKLLIRCNESMDYGSVQDNIYIVDSSMQEIKGTWQLLEQETILSFQPIELWKNGYYQILCNPEIEDLAGNNLNRLFDKEIKNTSNNQSNHQKYSLGFTIN